VYYCVDRPVTEENCLKLMLYVSGEVLVVYINLIRFVVVDGINLRGFYHIFVLLSLIKNKLTIVLFVVFYSLSCCIYLMDVKMFSSLSG